MRQKSHLLYRVYEMRVSMVRDGFGPILHENSACHRFGGDKMFNFTKAFERNRLVVCKRIHSQWSNSTIICTIAYEDYTHIPLFV